jgi:transposase
MTRKANLKAHLTSDELETRYKTATSPRDARHWQLLWQISLENTIQNSARMIAMHYDQARNLVRKYNQQGPDSIPDQRKTRNHTPRNPLLSPEQRRKLFEALQQKHPDGGLWTGPKVATWIETETGREQVLPQLGWTYLKRLGFSLLRPRPRHEQTSEEKQAEFKKTLLNSSTSVVNKRNLKVSASQAGRWMNNGSD